jgi:hypothetical protein
MSSLAGKATHTVAAERLLVAYGRVLPYLVLLTADLNLRERPKSGLEESFLARYIERCRARSGE